MRLFKTLLSVVLLLTFSLNLTAQTEDEMMKKEMMEKEEMMKKSTWENDRFDFFIGGYLTGGAITDGIQTSYGLGVGIQKRYIFVGIFGELGDLGDVVTTTEEMRRVNYGIIGPWLGVRTNPNSKVGFYASVKGGTGFGNYNLIEGGGDALEDPDDIHVIRPELGAEFKLGQTFNIAGHLGYDFTSSIHEFPTIEDADLRKLNLGISLRLMLNKR